MRTHPFRAAPAGAAILLPLRAEAELAAPAAMQLRILPGKTLKLELPAASETRPVGLFDSERREMLSFRVPTEQFVAIAAEPELELKAGNARTRLRTQGMSMRRDVARRLTPASAGVR
jgi:hypothetical protein